MYSAIIIYMSSCQDISFIFKLNLKKKLKTNIFNYFKSAQIDSLETCFKLRKIMYLNKIEKFKLILKDFLFF